MTISQARSRIHWLLGEYGRRAISGVYFREQMHLIAIRLDRQEVWAVPKVRLIKPKVWEP